MYVTISSDQIVGLLIIDLATTSYITEHVRIINARRARLCRKKESRDTNLSKKYNILVSRLNIGYLKDETQSKSAFSSLLAFFNQLCFTGSSFSAQTFF